VKSNLALSRKNLPIRRNRPDTTSSHESSPKKDVNLSVIIPTYNRASQLNNCLSFLFKQNYPLKKYEVIVIDDNSHDETPEVLSRYSAKYSNLKVIRNIKRKGPYYSRNLGVNLSKGEIVLFTDDDCTFSDDWLLEFEKAFRNGEISCVQGTQQYRGEFPSLEAEGKFYLKMLQKQRGLDTKNLAIRRKLILKYSFDEALGTMGDRELGVRLARNNIEVKYDPHFSVVHAPNHRFKDQITRAKLWGTDFAYLYENYGWKGSNPRLQYPFPMLLFFYLASFPYFLIRFRSLRGTIGFTSMLIVVGLYFKIAIRKTRAS
jgi:glycosyltransferase involved in cell wall biosynthesis